MPRGSGQTGSAVEQGKRYDALDKCTEAVKKGIESNAFTATAEEIELLAKLDPKDQNTIAADRRKGKEATVADAIISRGIKTPKAAKKKPPTPPKQLDRPALYKQWNTAIGPLVRLVDSIGKQVGEMNMADHKAVLSHLNDATTAMKKWLEVE